MQEKKLKKLKQDRDLEILKFLTRVRIATNQDIQQVFFNGLNPCVCYRRLSHLVECDAIKRAYYNFGRNKNIYIYYLDKKPSVKILEHDLLITKFVVNLIKEGYEILEFEKTPIVAGVKPDAEIWFKKNNVKYGLFLEVQLSTTHSCQEKYYNMKSKVDRKIPSTLYIVSDKEIIIRKLRDFKTVLDNLEMEKISSTFNAHEKKERIVKK